MLLGYFDTFFFFLFSNQRFCMFAATCLSTLCNRTCFPSQYLAFLMDYKDISIIFTDLDGTLFPGAYEGYETHQLPNDRFADFKRNMTLLKQLEDGETNGRGCSIPVIPATGNNLRIAQSKFDVLLSVNGGDGDDWAGTHRDLDQTPGIYCNGALVKGIKGAEWLCLNLGNSYRLGCDQDKLSNRQSSKNFIVEFVDSWIKRQQSDSAEADKAPFPVTQYVCVVGLGRQSIRALDLCAASGSTTSDMKSYYRDVCDHFTTHLNVTAEWVSSDAFKANADDVLSLLVLFPLSEYLANITREFSVEQLQLAVQAFLHNAHLIHFMDPEKRLTNGDAGTNEADASFYDVVCKHVRVPGLGPEIDISPVGVNKGSAIKHFLSEYTKSAPEKLPLIENHQIAVLGDGENDIELFGRCRCFDNTASSSGLLPLPNFPEFRPAVRVAMPWAKDQFLLQDANVVSRVDEVFKAILDSNS